MHSILLRLKRFMWKLGKLKIRVTANDVANISIIVSITIFIGSLILLYAVATSKLKHIDNVSEKEEESDSDPTSKEYYDYLMNEMIAKFDELAIQLEFSKNCEAADITYNEHITSVMAMFREVISYELLGPEFDTLRNRHAANYKGNLIPESCGSPLQNIFLTSWYTDDSIFNKLFNMFPSNFHHFNPLINNQLFKPENVYLRPLNLSVTPIELINDLFHCKFNGVKSINDLDRKYNFNRYVMDDKFRRESIDQHTDMLHDGILNAFCTLFPMQSYLSVLPSMNLVEALFSLKNNAQFSKVILMTRDPRGIIAERNGCESSTSCKNVKEYCAGLTNDSIRLQAVKNKFPDDFLHIRYEVLILSTKTIIDRFFKFYGIDFTEELEKLVNAAMREDNDIQKGPDALMSWTTNLSVENIQEIQTICKEAIQSWGYKIIPIDRISDTDYLRKFYYAHNYKTVLI